MDKSFGKYTLFERLGGGGMAEVFKARLIGPAGFEKQLALKLILPHVSDDPRFVQMFIQEATLAARLDHANIVRIYEFDRIEDRYYIAMELVDGPDLRQVLQRCSEIDRPLRVAEALAIATEVCKGLAFAHGELTPDAPEVIHRDISPHNIIVSRAGEVKITDFGIAKLASAASVTNTGRVKGKLAYMSPEQAGGEVLDKRSDLFSLGCVLWEMLAAQRLFVGPNELVILENLKSTVIRSPGEHNPDVPEELDRVVLSALARDRQQRIDSASGLGRRLDRILNAYPDLHRATALAGLVRDLFGVAPVRQATAVMPSTPSAQADAAKPPDASSAASPGSRPPRPVEPGSELSLTLAIRPEPGAPEGSRSAEEDAADRPEPPVWTPPARRGRFGWWIVLFLAPLVAVGGILFSVLPTEPGRKHDSVEAVVPEEIDKPTSSERRLDETELAAQEPKTASEQGDKTEKENPLQAGSKTPTEQAGGDIAVRGTDREKVPTVPRTHRKAVRYGWLHVNANTSWVKVFYKGTAIGQTPFRKRFPIGTYEIRLVNRGLGVDVSYSLTVYPGKETRKILDLSKHRRK